MKTWFWRRKKETIGIIFQSFIGAKHTKQLIYFIIIRFYILITDWPVVAQSIYASAFEIFWPEAQ